MTLDDDVRKKARDWWLASVPMERWLCDDPEHHFGACRIAEIVYAGYEVWRRTPRLTNAQREEVEHAFRESTVGQAVCLWPAAHVTHSGLVLTAVFAGYTEAE